MKATPQILLSAALIWLSHAVPARAEPVTLTSGFLVALSPPGLSPQSAVLGTQGFSVTGQIRVGLAAGHFFPEAMFQCSFFGTGCRPGDSLSLTAGLVPPDSLDFTVVTYQGLEYRDFGTASFAALSMVMTGSVELPGFSDGSSRTVTGPFQLTGLFADAERDIQATLTGRGLASLLLSPVQLTDGTRGWSIDQMRYDFQESDPVPEPATWLLLGTGLATIVRRYRSRANI